MTSLVYYADDERATDALGAALADALPEGTTVALCGTLGAGKTRLAQAIAAALGIDRREVLSPTFVLIGEHHGRRALYHIDAYRVASQSEFQALGADEYFDGDGLVLIEWADRVPDCLPRDRLEIHIEVTGPTSRRFEIGGLGRLGGDLLERLRMALLQTSPVSLRETGRG
jgi:tRNA threonylcarbamoyladenosine biosynthesis protein TsaE